MYQFESSTPGALGRSLAFVFGLAVPVVAAVLLLAGPGLASHIPDRLLDTFARQKVASLLRTTYGDETSWRFIAHDARPASLAAWTFIGASIAGIPANSTEPRLKLSGTVRGPVASMVPIPLSIENRDQLDGHAFVVVTNVPEHAALSAGKPIDVGTWIVPAREAANLAIISYTLPAPRQKLLIDLLTEDGKVLSRAQALLEIA